METIKIAHLYYDLMNLYGENGNVRCLEKYLKKANISVSISYLSIHDPIDFDLYDVFYIGSGNKENFLLTLQDIKKYENKIKEVFENKFFLVTGNALNLFGNTYTNNKTTYDCLHLLNFDSKERKRRIVGEKLYKTPFIKECIIGFENRSSMIVHNKEEKLFEAVSSSKGKTEGVYTHHFYGTYLLGPLLVRNPYFTQFFIKEFCKMKKISCKYKIDSIELTAYEKYLEHFEND